MARMTGRLLFRIVTATLLLSCDGEGAVQERGPDVAVQEVRGRTPEPLRGHRFRVIGDVDGDGHDDTLTERFIDPATGHETDKFIADASYDSLSARIWRMKPLSFVECSDPSIGRLFVREGDSFGLAHLMNEGDLNGDERDEIGWVGHWIDYSNVNTYHITSWNGSEWVELASFGMWEWQLPELPGSEREFGLIGQTGLHVLDTSTTHESPADLVWPTTRGRISVLGRTEEADLETLALTLDPMEP